MIQAIVDTYSGKQSITPHQMDYAVTLLEGRGILKKLGFKTEDMWSKINKMTVKQYRYMLALTYEGEDRKLRELLK